MATVITATASPRRPPRRAWSPIRMGQVAMTMAAAQTTERRNGSITQTLVAIIGQDGEDAQGDAGEVECRRRSLHGGPRLSG